MGKILFFIIIMLLVSLMECKVCTSLDIRNTPEDILEYKDCRVVDGNLQILLMEAVDDPSEYFNRSFSELVEITGYLIVYRLHGLTSLNLIFPKLAMINGEDLFFGYSLVLFDLVDLEEVGLRHLQNIGAGKVRIQNCTNICYVNTINWKAIGVSEVVVKGESNCGLQRCPYYCGGYCWNDFECQVINETKCHPSCVGCYKVNSPKDCILCKYFNDSGTCVRNCTKSKVIDDSSRCIDVEECVKNGNGSIFKNACLKKCPNWFDRNSEGFCKSLENKLCQGTKVNNKLDLSAVSGCTYINGSLEISLHQYIRIKDLVNALGKIHTISGYLKISRANAITTLDFFKKLKNISGQYLWSLHYSLFVVDNPNLVELFHENSSVVIEKGEALFQNNPYLCPSEISKINVSSIINVKNGEQTSCTLIDLNVTILENNSTNVTMSWSPPANESLIGGYTIYYVESDSFSPVKIRDGFTDSWGKPLHDGWNTFFVRNNSVCLKGLKAFTRYNYYIKTQFYLQNLNQQTPIYNFTTDIDDPSEPVNVEIKAESDSVISLTWITPSYLNGNLTYFKLAVYRQEDYQFLAQQRNYCVHPSKEKCSCSKSDEFLLFHSNGTCIGYGDAECNRKTIYETDTPNSQKLKIKKRSTENYTRNGLQEFIINETKGWEFNYSVSGLRHFTLYTVFLQACNSKDEEKKVGKNDRCGGSEMVFARTMKKRRADAITEINVKTDGRNVTVNWTQPFEPNSVILAYKIEYKEVSSQGLSSVECIPSQIGRKDIQFNISGLPGGKYGVRVQAVSLAGSGEFSGWEYFQISKSKTTGKDESWAYGLLGLVGAVVIIILGCVIWRRYKLAKDMEIYNLVSNLRIQTGVQEEDEWKLDDDTIEIIRDLQQNSFHQRLGAKFSRNNLS